MIYDFSVKDMSGNEVSLSTFKDKVLLIVNTASKCGFTPQYRELEELYQELPKDKFAILGFPCNQFGGQEPGDEKAIKEFCELNFGVSFPMFAKVEVNGKHTIPLYLYLKDSLPGIFGTKDVKWNFTKFLIDKDGTPLKRYAPTDSPKNIRADIVPLIK